MAKELFIAALLVVLCALCSGHDPRFQNKQEQCPVAKNEVAYRPNGRDFMLGNLSIYESFDTAPDRLLIAVYDIFGDTRNTRMFADLLSVNYGFRVIVPDFYRGEPWDHTKWPPV